MEIIRVPEDVNRAIDSLVDYMQGMVTDGESWLLIGIANGGIALAGELQRRFATATGLQLPMGELNVSFHRDDIGSRPITRPKEPTRLPDEVHHRSVILVDDVIHSGRTIRAALDELFEHGRPKRVRLLTLVDRGHRVVPIQPDYAAISFDMDETRKLHVVIDPDDAHGNRIWVQSTQQGNEVGVVNT